MVGISLWRCEDVCVKFWKMMSAPHPNKKDNDMSNMWLNNVNLQGSLVIDVQDLPLLAGFWSSLQSGEYPGYPWRPGYPENGFEGRCRKEEAQATLSNFRSSWLKRRRTSHPTYNLAQHQQDTITMNPAMKTDYNWLYRSWDAPRKIRDHIRLVIVYNCCCGKVTLTFIG